MRALVVPIVLTILTIMDADIIFASYAATNPSIYKIFTGQANALKLHKWVSLIIVPYCYSNKTHINSVGIYLKGFPVPHPTWHHPSLKDGLLEMTSPSEPELISLWILKPLPQWHPKTPTPKALISWTQTFITSKDSNVPWAHCLAHDPDKFPVPCQNIYPYTILTSVESGRDYYYLCHSKN